MLFFCHLYFMCSLPSWIIVTEDQSNWNTEWPSLKSEAKVCQILGVKSECAGACFDCYRDTSASFLWDSFKPFKPNKTTTCSSCTTKQTIYVLWLVYLKLIYYLEYQLQLKERCDCQLCKLRPRFIRNVRFPEDSYLCAL